MNNESNDMESVTNNSEIHLDGDGDDYGPAPLQNDYIPDESFEGVIQLANGNNACGSTAEMAERTITNVVNSIHGILNTERQQPLSEQGTSVVLQNSEVFQNDGFVDMNRTQFVWARAFPSCYRPSYINMNGTMKWIIMNDITGFDSEHPREKSVQFKDWIQHQLWRSDSFPEKHPTWSICMLNQKMKNALQKQGTYAISTDQLDPSVTIKEIRKHHQEVI